MPSHKTPQHGPADSAFVAVTSNTHEGLFGVPSTRLGCRKLPVVSILIFVGEGGATTLGKQFEAARQRGRKRDWVIHR